METSACLECAQVDPKAAHVLDAKFDAPFLQPSPHLRLDFGLTSFGMMSSTDDDEGVILAAFAAGHGRKPPHEGVDLAHRLLHRPPMQVNLRQVISDVAAVLLLQEGSRCAYTRLEKPQLGKQSGLLGSAGSWLPDPRSEAIRNGLR